jgi:hypothetical protein
MVIEATGVPCGAARIPGRRSSIIVEAWYVKGLLSFMVYVFGFLCGL